MRRFTVILPVLHFSVIYLLFKIITVNCADKERELNYKLKETSSNNQIFLNRPKQFKEHMADWAKSEPIKKAHLSRNDYPLKVMNKAKTSFTRLDDGVSAARKIIQSQKLD